MQNGTSFEPGMSLGEAISDYWNGRAQSYSNGVNGELQDERKDAWETYVSNVVSDILAAARAEKRIPCAADLGCGPGFFCVILAEMGFSVDAVDGSPDMLAHARENVAKEAPNSSVAFHECDLLSLPFDDNTFDVCISRNVTWLMRNPKAAYAEWLRVLRPGGKLIAFDANWYRYLVDPVIAAQRRADQEANVLEGWDEEAQATSDEEKRCERIAEELPLTPVLRPQWDVQTLGELGAAQVCADEDAWKVLWTENEQAYYSSSPTFAIEAVK